MADIQIYINNILNAVYGEEVRASLVNALTKINADNEKYQAIKEEVVTARDTVVDQMTDFDEKYDKAIQAVTDLLQATSAAATIQNNLQTMVNAAGQKMDELDTAVGAATSKIADAVKVQDALDIAIGTAAQTKEALDESNALGSQAKTDLDAVIKAAGMVAEELRNTLASINTTAEEQLAAIRNAGTEEIKNLTNTGTTQIAAVNSTATTQLQSIRTAGAEEVEKVQQATAEAVKGKLDKNQGTENAGKALVVGADGNVVPGEVQSGSGNGIAIVNSANGASPLVISDSAERTIVDFGLIGNTEQVSTTGKNLFDKNRLKKGFGFSDGAMEIVPDDGYISDYIKIDINATYYISGNHKGLSTRMIFFDSDNKPIGRSGTSSYETKTLSSSDVGVVYEGKDKNDICYVLFWFYTINSTDIDEILNQNIQLEKGATATAYEPYTGGKPSPSPEYPQEIVNVGKLNEETGKYEVQVVFNGGNLFPAPEPIPGYYNSANGELILNGNLGFSYDIPFEKMHGEKVTLNIVTKERIRYRYYCVDSENVILKEYINSILSVGDNNITFEVPVGTKKILLSILNITPEDDVEITISSGSKVLPYEPYKSQTLTLTSDRPITKWDKLVEQDGQIGWLYGSFMVSKSLEQDFSGIHSSGAMMLNNAYDIANGEYLLCDKLICDSVSPNEFKDGGICANYNFLYIRIGDVKTRDQALEWLKNNALTIVGKLSSEPEFHPLPQAQQDAIRALKTYYPTTVITADGGEMSPDVTVSYVADTKNYIDGKFAEMNAALVNTQKALL